MFKNDEEEGYTLYRTQQYNFSMNTDIYVTKNLVHIKYEDKLLIN